MRNPNDKLWDIPVQKRNIASENYRMPTIHPSMYRARQNETKPDPHPLTRLKPKNNIFSKELNQYHDLIDHNILDTFLTNQRKKTEATYCKTNLSPKSPSLGVIITKKRTHADLVQYFHAACFSPVKSTFEKAIKKNFFNTWPGLTPQLVTKHLHTPTATTQGHLHQEQQNLQSKKSPALSVTATNKVKEHLRKLRAKQKNGEHWRMI